MFLTDPLTGRALLDALELVDMIGPVLANLSGGAIEIGRWARAKGYDGYTLRSRGRWWWLGFWIQPLATAGGSCVVLQLPGFEGDGDSKGSPTGLPKPERYTSGRNNGWVLPLPIQPGVPLEELAVQHARVVMDWLNRVPTSGGLGGVE